MFTDRSISISVTITNVVISPVNPPLSPRPPDINVIRYVFKGRVASDAFKLGCISGLQETLAQSSCRLHLWVSEWLDQFGNVLGVNMWLFLVSFPPEFDRDYSSVANSRLSSVLAVHPDSQLNRNINVQIYYRRRKHLLIHSGEFCCFRSIKNTDFSHVCQG